MNLERKNYFSGAPMEQVDGYSRMVKKGPFLYCGGTTSVQPDGTVVAEGDSYGQVKYVVEKLLGIVEEAGGCKEDIYSVKIYATPEYDEEEGVKAFTEIFQGIQPILSCVTIHKLTRPTQLVEIEMNGIIGSGKGDTWEGMSLKRVNYPYETETAHSKMVTVGPFIFIEDARDSQALLMKANADVTDIVKVKSYATSACDTEISGIKKEECVYSNVLVEKTKKDKDTEIFAIRGCGGSEIQKEWGSVDFRKKVSNQKSGAWAKYVNVGPFLYAGVMHSMDEVGKIVGVGDSERQESYVVETFTKEMKEFGYEPEDMIKFKAYYTMDFGALYGEENMPYYEEVYKPIKPLYTGVYVSKVGEKDEIFEMEMMAMK